MTTKEDSMMRSSLLTRSHEEIGVKDQEIGVRVIDKLQRPPKNRFVKHQVAMTNTSFKGGMIGQQTIPQRAIQTAKGINRRPLTSKQPQA